MGLECKLTFTSPVATTEFFKFAGILSAALSQHHLLVFKIAQLESNESALRMRWPKYWSFSFSIIPSKEQPELISFRIDWWISLQSKGLSRVFSNTTVQKHQFFGTQLSL